MEFSKKKKKRKIYSNKKINNKMYNHCKAGRKSIWESKREKIDQIDCSTSQINPKDIVTVNDFLSSIKRIPYGFLFRLKSEKLPIIRQPAEYDTLLNRQKS